MTLTVDLPQATVDRLRAEAQTTGKDVETLVREAVEAKLARRKRTLTEVLKPIRDAIAASGMSETEANAFFEQELRALRAERRSGQARP